MVSGWLQANLLPRRSVSGAATSLLREIGEEEMKNDTGLTEASRQYAAAHAAHYETKDLREALELYRGILAAHPHPDPGGPVLPGHRSRTSSRKWSPSGSSSKLTWAWQWPTSAGIDSRRDRFRSRRRRRQEHDRDQGAREGPAATTDLLMLVAGPLLCCCSSRLRLLPQKPTRPKHR